MRALWLVRENLTQHPGGDTTQIVQTAGALRAQGVHVDLCSDPRPNFDGYDVVHLFHLDRLWENVAHCRRIRAQKRPAALSTIYWPPDEFDRGGRAGWQGLLARLVGSRVYQNLRIVQRWALHAAHLRSLHDLRPRWSFDQAAQFVLETVAVLLPNSQAEGQQIEQRFGVSRPTVVVPNAADGRAFGLPAGGKTPQRAGVLCAGRVEPRKNQLALIRALQDTDIQLTIVGQAGRYSGGYYRRCHQAAGANVQFVDQQTTDVLRELYWSARVHACVSWYETPGLASLEAALCGCTLVVTPGGSTREYFGEDAHYCRPDDRAGIRSTIEAALSAPPSDQLSRRVAREFTWGMAAERTRAGYQTALKTA